MLNIQFCCHLEIPRKRDDTKERKDQLGLFTFIVGNPIYIQRRLINVLSPLKEIKLFSVRSKNRLSSWPVSNPFEGLYRSTEKLSVRPFKLEGPTVTLETAV